MPTLLRPVAPILVGDPVTDESVLSFANNINTHEGGTHEEGFRKALTKAINDFARSKGILKEKDME